MDKIKIFEDNIDLGTFETLLEKLDYIKIKKVSRQEYNEFKGDIIKSSGTKNKTGDFYDLYLPEDLKAGEVLEIINKLNGKFELEKYSKIHNIIDKIKIIIGIIIKGKSNSLLKLGKYEEAINMCNKSIELNPEDHISYINIGNSLYLLGNYGEAINIYNKALDLDPENSNTYNNKGNCLFKLKRYEEAIEMYDITIKLDPKNSNTYYNKGNCLIKLNRYEETIEMCNKCIELNPKDKNAYSNMGNCLYLLGKYEEALQIYSKIIELDPRNSTAYYNKSNCLLRLNRYEEAYFHNFVCNLIDNKIKAFDSFTQGENEIYKMYKNDNFEGIIFYLNR